MNLQLVYRYILSLSKNKSMFNEKYENKKQKQKKLKDQKRRKKYYLRQVLNPGLPTELLDALPIAP